MKIKFLVFEKKSSNLCLCNLLYNVMESKVVRETRPFK